jgi:hypothetical protein
MLTVVTIIMWPGTYYLKNQQVMLSAATRSIYVTDDAAD